MYFKTSTWKSFVNPWRALSTDVKTGRTEAKTFLATKLLLLRTFAWTPFLS